MTIEQQLQDHEERIAALEARQPTPHNTPETNPFMRGEPREPRQPISEDFQRVFGFWADPMGRRLIPPGSKQEADWITKQGKFTGIVAREEWPEGLASAEGLLMEHYTLADIDATIELVGLGGQHYVAFPEIAAAGYGTTYPLMIGLRVFLQDAADARMDFTISQIEKRRSA